MKKFEDLEKLMNYFFKNKDLLKQALTHKSFNTLINNEKLEFLGDRVLALVLSKKILELYPNEKEGVLVKRFSFLVNKKTCLKISNKLKLKNFLILGNTYKKKNKIEDKILSDACESIIGAIYLDGGFKQVENFILKIWQSEIKHTNVTEIDAKTKLQEHSLKKNNRLPVYKVIKSFGPKHKPLYKVSVSITGSKDFFGMGKSIKSAEQKAAKLLIKNIKIK